MARHLACPLCFRHPARRGAQLYKSVTSDGRVTYSDRPPEDARASTSVIKVDTRGNELAARAAPVIVGPRGESENEKIIRRRPPEPDRSAVLAATRALEEARQALAAAQESSTPDDWIYFGTGRAPRPEYLARLESLETRVKGAETALADAERKVRLGF